MADYVCFQRHRWSVDRTVFSKGVILFNLRHRMLFNRSHGRHAKYSPFAHFTAGAANLIWLAASLPWFRLSNFLGRSARPVDMSLLFLLQNKVSLSYHRHCSSSCSLLLNDLLMNSLRPEPKSLFLGIIDLVEHCRWLHLHDSEALLDLCNLHKVLLFLLFEVFKPFHRFCSRFDPCVYQFRRLLLLK
jgi:hypothetical protein